MEIFNTFVWFNQISDWLIALGILLGVLAGLWLVKAFLVRRLSKLASRTTTDVDNFVVDLIDRTNVIFIVILSVYVASLAVFLESQIRQILTMVLFIVSIIQLGLWGNGMIQFFLQRQVQKQAEEDAATATTLNAFSMVAKFILWSIITLVILDNLPGVEVTSLIASLGIAGVAVGLAVQNILSDLFASLSIALDKPFVMGDFIIVGDLMGNVEHIGLKSTRVRSISGEQLVFSNSDLLSSRIRNYKRMARRRVAFPLGLTYDTPPEKMRKVSALIEEIISNQEKVTFYSSHFKSFGSFSLDFENVYFVEDPDYKVFMDIQQAINLEIMERFQDEGIEFAFPTQTLFLHNNGTAESELTEALSERQQT